MNNIRTFSVTQPLLMENYCRSIFHIPDLTRQNREVGLVRDSRSLPSVTWSFFKRTYRSS